MSFPKDFFDFYTLKTVFSHCLFLLLKKHWFIATRSKNNPKSNPNLRIFSRIEKYRSKKMHTLLISILFCIEQFVNIIIQFLFFNLIKDKFSSCMIKKAFWRRLPKFRIYLKKRWSNFSYTFLLNG